MGVGMPQGLLLEQFGEYVQQAFGHIPYHVGSSLRNKDGWRDVDVRLILPDEEYDALGFGGPYGGRKSRKWVATILAWSAFGKVLTGLPIDFQVQRQTEANKEYSPPDCPRSALFVVCDAYAAAARQEAASEKLVNEYVGTDRAPVNRVGPFSQDHP